MLLEHKLAPGYIITIFFIRQNKAKGFGHEKTPETLNFQGFSSSYLRIQEINLVSFGHCQALPKTLAKTEMVLRFPLGFA